jgi:LAO/AO transport system kinase
LEFSNHIENNPDFKGLAVKKGIEHPGSVDDQSVQRFMLKKRKLLPADEYVKGILEGDRSILSQAVTLVESSKPSHQAIAREIIKQCLPCSGRSIRLGITGIPGVGKSTFIEALGTYITARGGRLAVLASDPSSERSKGSMLGDKTRMEELAGDKNAYIRPSPTAGSLGGVARKTREAVILCEAAGFDHIFIETVGVGQSETAVHSMSDFFLLLMLSGAGDELQGIKRGIMEMADLIAINKADGDNLGKALIAQTQYQNALHLFPQKDSEIDPRVLICSSLNKTGIAEIWEEIERYRNQTVKSGYFEKRRNEQSIYWMHETIQNHLHSDFYHNALITEELKRVERKVMEGEITSFDAAVKLLEMYMHLK